MSEQEDETYSVKNGPLGRLREKKSTKVLPPRAAKLSFKYESQDLENAVSAVLCGMSIKEAADTYNISKSILKQALSDEMDNEPEEETAVDADSDTISTRVAECQAAYESLKNENNKRRVAEAMKDRTFGDEVDVTCGVCSGVLYRRKFFCPGLHCECILTDGQWVTPKQFSIMGGKASLKNWKNAIRINNVNLRNFMEQGSLDFMDHQINCSGKCYHKTSGGPGKYQSKINCLERKTLGNIEAMSQTITSQSPNSQMLEENLKDDIPSFVPMVQNVGSSQAFSVLRKAQGSEDTETEDNQPVFPAPMIKTEQLDAEYGAESHNPIIVDAPVLDISPVASAEIPQQRSLLLRNQVLQSQAHQSLSQTQMSVSNQPSGDGMSSTSVTSGIPAGGNSTVRYLIQNGVIKGRVKQISKHQFVLQNNANDQPPEILQVASAFPDIESIMKDSKKFWQGISDIGLLAEIFNEIKSKMRSLKHEIFNTGINEENSEKMSLLVNHLGLQTKVKYKLANHKVAAEAQNRRIQEEINELQKKMAESQMRQAELKRKSNCFEELLQKRPRREKNSSSSNKTVDNNPSNGEEAMETLGVITKEEALDSDDDESETNENKSETKENESETEENKSETNWKKKGEKGNGIEGVRVIDVEGGVDLDVNVESDDSDENTDIESDSEESEKSS